MRRYLLLITWFFLALPAVGPAGAAQIRVGTTVVPSYDATGPDAKAQGAAFDKSLGDALGATHRDKIVVY